MLKRSLVGMVLVVAVIVTGCAHAPTEAERQTAFESQLDTFKGRDINDVITESGPPTKSFQMPNGNTMYTWSEENRRYVSSTKRATIFSPVKTDTREIVHSCQTNYIVGKGQKIEKWTYSGNSCF